METKNIIITNHTNALNDAVDTLLAAVATLNDNEDENRGTIKTLDVILTNIRSQLTIIQQDIDNY